MVYTPGPWELVKNYGGAVGYYVVGPTGRNVALLSGWKTKEFEANARLVAAAPRLLGALKGALIPRRTLEEVKAWEAEARAAIAEAEGRDA